VDTLFRLRNKGHFQCQLRHKSTAKNLPRDFHSLAYGSGATLGCASEGCNTHPSWPRLHLHWPSALLAWFTRTMEWLDSFLAAFRCATRSPWSFLPRPVDAPTRRHSERPRSPELALNVLDLQVTFVHEAEADALSRHTRKLHRYRCRAAACLKAMIRDIGCCMGVRDISDTGRAYGDPFRRLAYHPALSTTNAHAAQTQQRPHSERALESLPNCAGAAGFCLFTLSKL
jgi:hypothetical protein